MKKLLFALVLIVIVVCVGCEEKPAPVTADPYAGVPGGVYDAEQTISLQCDTKNATIYYTLDGSDPISNGAVYDSPISISYSTCVPKTILKIVAKANKYEYSQVMTYEYIVKGPAGGYVFYDCDADNSKGNGDGLISEDCGWRYLEVAPYDVNVGESTSFIFGYYRESPNGDNLYVNGSTEYVEGTADPEDNKSTSCSLGTGKANTVKLVSAMGDSAYKGNTDTTSSYAAKACSDFSCGGFDDWFLPSERELYNALSFLQNNGLMDSAYYEYWSSSEASGMINYSFATYRRDSSIGNVMSSYVCCRICFCRVRAVRMF